MLTIPNAAEAFDPNQAEPDSVDIDIIVAGVAGNGVIGGCGVTAVPTGGLSVRVAAGSVAIDGVSYQVDGSDFVLDPAETNPRFDLIVAFDNTDEGAMVVTGTAAAEPVFPKVPADCVALAAVFVPESAIETVEEHITDKRCFVPDPDGGAAEFPSGTSMLFVQTSAPVSWTKDTTHNNKALRIVNGSAGSGGSIAFTTAFASQTPAGTVGSTTLSTAQMPVHGHPVPASTTATGGNPGAAGSNDGTAPATSGSTGSGSSHTHSFTGTAMNLAVQYVDTIIATKD